MTNRLQRVLLGLIRSDRARTRSSTGCNHKDCLARRETLWRQQQRQRSARWRQPTTAFNWLSYADRGQSLRLLRQNQVHVDTNIQTSDGFCERVHWQVMAALCPKLIESCQLSNRARDATVSECRRDLRLPHHIDGAMALLLIECAYGETKLSLDRSNLDRFYEIAVEYEIYHALAICLDFARTILDVNNCIYLHLLSLRHDHRKLRRASYSMIRANFKLILHVNKDFQLLGSNQLKQLLLDNLLKLNDDEEIGWLAIVRWQRGQCLAPNELSSIYNQMVSAHQDVQLVHRPAPVNQLQLLTTKAAQISAENNPRGSRIARAGWSPNSNARNSSLARLPMRLTLDFYSPADPIESSQHSRQLGQQNYSNGPASKSRLQQSPLRRAAEGQARAKSQASDLQSQHKDELELYSLVRCLRFMRFKSLAAFDSIERCEFIKTSVMLTQLVRHMRVAYKLRHGLALAEDEKKSISSEQLERYRFCDKSRSERFVRSIARLARFRPRPRTSNDGTAGPRQQRTPQIEPTSDNFQSPQIQCPIIEHQVHPVGQSQKKEQSELSNGRIKSALASEFLGARTLERADKPRVPISVGLLIGGWQDGRLSKSIWAYDFVSDKWFKLNIKLPEARAYHASCSSPTRGHIYVFGGTNGHAILNSMLKLNLASDVYISSRQGASNRADSCVHIGGKSGQSKGGPNGTLPKLVYKFKHLRPMNERRCHLSGVFHSDGRLYALGGHNGGQRLRSGEWYDAKSNQWHAIAEMTIARSDASACSHENKIFIAGGQISDQFIQSSVEFYKSSDNTWTFAAPMIIPRMSFCMVSYKGQMLAIGGANGFFGGEEAVSMTRTVERYNHNSASWSFCAPMIAKRCSFGAMQIGNKLLVMGGHGSGRRLKSCESLRVGQFNGQSISSLLAMAQSIHSRNQRQLANNNQTATPAANEPTLEGIVGARPPARPEIPREARAGSANRDGSDADLHQLVNRMPTATRNELLNSVARLSLQSNSRSALKWTPRSKLPERRSGFSVVTVHKLKNAKDFTYYGYMKPRRTLSEPAGKRLAQSSRPSFIKRRGRWSRFKVIKRRKLIKHLKIALIVTGVICVLW